MQPRVAEIPLHPAEARRELGLEKKREAQEAERGGNDAGREAGHSFGFSPAYVDNTRPVCKPQQLKETFMKLFALAVLVLSSSAFAGSPWDKACQQFGYKALKSPTTGLVPGWVIRKSDQEPFQTGCFSGTQQTGDGFNDYQQAFTATTNADLKATLGKYGDVAADFSAVKSVNYSIQGLTEQRFVDLKPNLNNIDCSVKSGIFNTMTNIKSLLYVKGITLKYEMKTGVDVKAVLNTIKTQIGNIDAKADVKVGTDNTIQVTGTNLAIGFRAFTDSWTFHSQDIEVPANSLLRITNLIPNADYKFTYITGNPALNMRLASSRPGLVTKPEYKLEAGLKAAIAESNQYGAYMTATQMSDKSIKLSVEEWKVTMGLK
jgi:hypothetical protein